MTDAMACRLCGENTQPLFHQVVLAKHDVTYFRCPNCDLIQTENPYWLEEAYSSAIAAADTGAIRRNQLTTDLTTVLARILALTPKSPCLDYGGGHGVFVRMMRDRGFDFRWTDRYAENLFARGFEGDPKSGYQLITAFEVLEHLEDVQGELARIFAMSPSVILLSTLLHRDPDPNWWYYMPVTGQHIAFYSRRTMDFIAQRFGYAAAYSSAYTIFIKPGLPISPWRQKIAHRLIQNSRGDSNRWWVRAACRFIPGFPSLIISDGEAMGLGRR